jgi:hypothetical protein
LSRTFSTNQITNAAITSYTMGGFIHVLLVIAIIVVLLNLIQGRRVL